jgi:hypothetical protein
MHTLDVPVRPFDLAAKVDTVGQARVEKRDQSLAMLFRYTDIALVRASRRSSRSCHDVNPPFSNKFCCPIFDPPEISLHLVG